MALSKFFAIAYRNLMRHGRRTALTSLAVSLGLVVVMMMASLIDGMVETMVADGIRVMTGHVQVRKATYETGRGSLLAEDLLRDGDELAGRVESAVQVKSAAPVLWLGGLLNTTQESVGIQIEGIRLDDAFHDPIREGIVAGSFLQPDMRGAVLLGRGLADNMGIRVGDDVSIATSNASGQGLEGVFTVVGLFDTGFPSLDQGRVIMPLAQAQAVSGVGDRFSSLIIMLNNQDDTAVVASALANEDLEILTWEDLNSLILESVENGLIFYYVMYGIVFVAVAVIIANTLLMSVFSRAREIGILAALGMNRTQIMLLFLIEGLILAIFGIALGLLLGMGAVAYMTYVGISIPVETAELVEGMAISTTMRGGFAPLQFIALSFALLVIVLLVSLYPAWFAAKMEPVEALHAL